MGRKKFPYAAIRRCLAKLPFFLFFLFAVTTGTAQDRRIALVIGNGAYASFNPLANPPTDARDMAKALESRGFEVSLLVDATLDRMDLATSEFGRAIARPDCVALFYFAGHGIQSEGINYLIPVDQDIKAETELRRKALSAQEVLGSMSAARNRLNVLILDACRDNPLAGRTRGGARGLAVVGNPPPETLILYSTDQGQVAEDGSGRNSPFTSALLKMIPVEGLEMSQLVKRVASEVKKSTDNRQMPFQYSNVTGDFWFADPLRAAPASTPAPAGIPEAVLRPERQKTSPETGKKPSLTVQKIYGSLVIETRTAGALHLNGEALGDIAPNASARLDNLEIGPARLEMRYAEGKNEVIEVPVVKDAATKVAFKYEKISTATIDFDPVPRDWNVSVNGREIGVTPLGKVTVEAGLQNIVLRKPGQKEVSAEFKLAPAIEREFYLGFSPESALRLPRRTIAIDGKAYDWEGIDPIWKAAPGWQYLMNQPGYEMTKLFLCRDEKYLYWKMDFAEKNPFAKLPKDNAGHIQSVLRLRISTSRVLTLCIQYDKKQNRINAVAGIDSGMWTQISDSAIYYQNSKDFLEARVTFATISSYIRGACGTQVQFGQLSINWNWLPNDLRTKEIFVDYE